MVLRLSTFLLKNQFIFTALDLIHKILQALINIM